MLSEVTLQTLAQRAERVLKLRLPSERIEPRILHSAMRYSVLGGGKRMRPLLVYAAGLALGARLSRLDAPACAVEIIHAYSLIHDDLPSMDNDELRRGKPTCHIAFGEATAILAGDALQALAFSVLAAARLASNRRKVRMLQRLADACGPAGMAGGQAIDLAAVGKPLGEADLDQMHGFKTGALIVASVLLGADVAGVTDSSVLRTLESYGRDFGLAFQIHDDILDVEGDTATLGKPQGSDAARGKPTYPAAIGLQASKLRCQQLKERALAAVEPLGPPAELLRQLAHYAIARAY